MARPLPLRRCGLTGGPTQCAPHQAADARYEATAAGCRHPSTAPAPPAHRPAAPGTLLHRRQDCQAPGSRTPEEPEAETPVQRYEWERLGGLIHVDVKTLARFRRVGQRITGNRQQGRSYGIGYNKVHAAFDDATRLAYVEVLVDEQKPR